MSTSLPKRLDLKATDAQAGVVADSRRTRPLFFDGKFLTAADLNREQSYLITRQADLARSLGFGVVDGLRVERSDRTASDVTGAAASLRLSAGHGLTPSGDAVVLPRDTVVDLSDVPRLEGLNASFGLARRPQPPFYNLSGLFVVGLRAVEFTANPTPVFPPSLQGSQSLQDGEIIEATAITLVPYESAAALNDPPKARARAAREIFLEQRPPKLPAGVLPLAMIYLRGGFLQWVDEFLVRREAGDDDRFGFGFAPRALAEAHFFHYRELLDEVPTPAAEGHLAAVDFFEILPPGGPLPVGTVDLKDFTQAFFPPEARVEMTLVPEDELAGLLEECLDQPPLDLRLKPEDNDALAILLLAPVPRASYREAVQQLTELRPVLRHVAPSLLGQQRPLQALHRLNEALAAKRKAGEITAPTAAELEAPIADAAWAKVLGPVPALWYVRRRNLPYASDLASKALPATTPPAILVPPQPILANIDENVALRVTAIGSAPLKYQWRKAGTAIAGATGPQLEFAKVKAANAASYDVTVTNDAGAATSSAASITLRQLPAITTQPKNVATTAGTNASFAVVATGTAPLRYQWRKNGTDIEGATDARLPLEKVQAADADSYDVTVTNDAGTVTSTVATLAVQLIQLPVITGQPQSINAPIGTNVVFTVVATGTAPLTFQWRRDGTDIAGATASSLTLSNVQPGNAASYDVTVTNAAGSVVSVAAVLTVQPAPVIQPPAITGQPQDVNAPANTSVNFSVAVAGTAPLKFQWRKNGAAISGATNATLALNTVQAADVGNYDVVVTNDAGSVTSAAAGLTVEASPNVQPPTITAQPQNVATSPGTTVNFKVGLAGTAPLKLQWRKNGTTINGAISATLVLANVPLADAGSYDVVVTNAAGAVTSTAASLTIEAAPDVQPPTITTHPQSVTTPPNATVNFSVAMTGTAPLKVQWRKNGAAVTGANAASLVLNNVQAADAGSYDAVVSNVAGSATSAAASLTIEGRPPVAPPTITAQPQNIAAPAGSNVILHVGVAGTAPFKFQWRMNGNELPGANSASLVLNTITAANTGRYDVIVANEAGGVTSESATLTVEEAPFLEITRQPRDIAVAADASAGFDVMAKGSPSLLFQWFRSKSATSAPVAIANATRRTFKIDRVTTDDVGFYRVEVSNGTGLAQTSNVVRLTIAQ